MISVKNKVIFFPHFVFKEMVAVLDFMALAKVNVTLTSLDKKMQ